MKDSRASRIGIVCPRLLKNSCRNICPLISYRLANWTGPAFGSTWRRVAASITSIGRAYVASLMSAAAFAWSGDSTITTESKSNVGRRNFFDVTLPSLGGSRNFDDNQSSRGGLSSRDSPNRRGPPRAAPDPPSGRVTRSAKLSQFSVTNALPRRKTGRWSDATFNSGRNDKCVHAQFCQRSKPICH